ncbi:hypothetical protein CTAYLR_000392 [Chrysophaeum taylorii]|uniref:Flap endonuclease 1 n=1 Tax=Chrysophaeum taylorii TaxID=2483200 RepID=A0AAD7XJT0_9STRA|nr:hypothetical protein CTAYLR_000392 [Chrysophaeum taylorii]
MKVINEEAPEAVREMEVEAYTGRIVAIDASMALYQFLIAIRSSGDAGGPAAILTNADGEQTSHIQGMFNRTIRLLGAGLKPVYVFDGKPPTLKGGELAKRSARRAEAEEKLKAAREACDTAAIEKHEGALVKVSRKDVDDVRALLTLMGVPVVDAPMEAEAQCAELVKGGKAHAAGTEDMDVLTFAAPVQLRRLTFASKGGQHKVLEVKHGKVLSGLGITHAQFVDFCILCGCDYTTTIKGVGPKTALKLIKQHNTIEAILKTMRASSKDCNKIPDGWLSADERARRRDQRRKEALAAGTKANVLAAAQTVSNTGKQHPVDDCRQSESDDDEPSDESRDQPEQPDATHKQQQQPDDEVPDQTMEAVNHQPNRQQRPDEDAPDQAAPERPEDSDEKMLPQADDGEEEPTEPEFVLARGLFTQHEVTPAAEIELKWSKPDEVGLRSFLVDKMGFNADRVDGAISKLKAAQGARKQQRMDSFFKVLPAKPTSDAVLKKRVADKKAKEAAARAAKKKKTGRK